METRKKKTQTKASKKVHQEKVEEELALASVKRKIEDNFKHLHGKEVLSFYFFVRILERRRSTLGGIV